MSPHAPSDLIWEVTRNYNSFLVKRRTGGGARFSRDPLNLASVHSRKHAGYANEKAIGINSNSDGQVVLTTKKSGSANKPASGLSTTTYGKNSSGRKIYRSVVGGTAKRGYRPDLREAAVARTSAFKKSQKPVKEPKPAKLRGKKAHAAQQS